MHFKTHFHSGWAPNHFINISLEYLILNSLKDKPAQGGEIVKAIEEFTRGFFSPGPDQVYPVLKMLADMGYVTCSDKEEKKVYTITEEGKEYFKKRQDILENLKSRVKEGWAFRDFGSGFMHHHHCGRWA
jgi:DNA-binding PadR family transcriptional regulator